MRMRKQANGVIGGVDTHKDSHAVVALDSTGQWLGWAQFPTNPTGYRELLTWLRDHGTLLCVGVEATGSYGAGLTRHLVAQQVSVLEVMPSRRRSRRGRNKSDPADAEAAARAALSGQATGVPKRADGRVEALRMIRLVRSSAIKARTQAANQLQALVETAPARLRERLRHHSVVALVDHALRWRTGKIVDPDSACRGTLAPLARRWRHLDQEIDGYDRELRRLTTELCPELLERVGVGPEVASPRACSWPLATIRSASSRKPASPHCAASPPSTPRQVGNVGTGSTAEATGTRIAPCGSLPSSDSAWTLAPRYTRPDERRRGAHAVRLPAVSNATSYERSIAS